MLDAILLALGAFLILCTGTAVFSIIAVLLPLLICALVLRVILKHDDFWEFMNRFVESRLYFCLAMAAEFWGMFVLLEILHNYF